MDNLISSEVNQLKSDFPKLADVTDEHLFALVCFRYFFRDGEFLYSDFVESFVDSANDGGIDLITTEEVDAREQLALIQSKMISSLSNSQDVIDAVTKMHQTVEDFRNERTASYSKKLKRVYKEKSDSLQDQPPNLRLVLFLSCELSPRIQERILEEISHLELSSKYEDIVVYSQEQIVDHIRNIKDPKFFVTEDKIRVAKEHGFIRKGDSGLLVNVWALSIRDLFDKHAERGLFEQNFRYFVRNKKIDDNIKLSLEEKRDQFWFLNNGIIIGCKDFLFDGNVVKLYDFSIVNGAQTSTLIGEYKGRNEDEDFVIPCKIVKSPDESEFSQFIGEIAEASNSQKPISDRDLKSNRREQRTLQVGLQKEEPKIYLEIKRGERLLTGARKRQLKRWQFINNEYLGQVILAFHLQQPGTARSNKRKLFTSGETYESVFVRRTFDKANIVDTLRLFDFYLSFLEKKSQSGGFSSLEEESIATNGKMLVPSVVGFMLKAKRGLLNFKKGFKLDVEVVKDVLSGGLFSEDLPDNIEEILEGLFSEIVLELGLLYGTRKEEESSVSNFFKTDSKYYSVILNYFYSKFLNNPIQKEKLFSNYFHVFE